MEFVTQYVLFWHASIIFQVGLEKVANDDTRILYCTTGVFLQKLIAAKSMNNYTHVILDEIHERDEDMDFTMLIVRMFLRTFSPQVKVIKMLQMFMIFK